jgi:hypothetical protein
MAASRKKGLTGAEYRGIPPKKSDMLVIAVTAVSHPKAYDFYRPQQVFG